MATKHSKKGSKRVTKKITKKKILSFPVIKSIPEPNESPVKDESNS